MPNTSSQFDPNEPMHAHVDFLMSLWCWNCQHEFERPNWGPTSESFYQYCADVSERAKAAGWTMLEDHPVCPECLAKRAPASPVIVP